MRNYFSILFLFISGQIFSQRVGIGTTTPHVSAALDIRSTTGGLLIPVMTQAQRNAIVLPAYSLLIFQADGITGFYYNNGTPASPNWIPLAEGGTSGWQLTGNTGTNPSTHFIGTTDIAPIQFKVNNVKAGFVDTSTFNTGLGFRVFDSITTGNFNTGYGYKSMTSVTIGTANTGIGGSSLRNNKTGNSNTAIGARAMQLNSIGNFNTAIGMQALYNNDTGHYNTAVGQFAMINNRFGTFNVAVGNSALNFNYEGESNTAVGSTALYSNLFGDYNTAIGESALFKNSASANTAVGAFSLWTNQHGSNNVAIGDSASYFSSGSYNTVIGSGAGHSNSGEWTTIIGIDAGRKNIVNGSVFIGSSAGRNNFNGTNNTYVGDNAGFTNTYGNSNTAIGSFALRNNEGGFSNVAIGSFAATNGSGFWRVAIGDSALYSNTSNFNVAIGAHAGRSNMNGSGNVFLGFRSAYESTGGGGNIYIGSYTGNKSTANTNYNVAIGHQSLNQSIAGDFNVAIGSNTGYNNLGSQNVFVGDGTGQVNTTGYQNVLVGSGAEVITNNLHNATAIGTYAKIGVNNAISLGDSTQGTTVGIGTAYPTKAGLVVNQTVGGAVHAMFGSNTTGVAIESNWPGIGFNAYYNGGRRFIATGFGAHINFDAALGQLIFGIDAIGTGQAGTAGNVATFSKNIRLRSNLSQPFFEPMEDGNFFLGSSGFRWNSVWSVNGVIQTSDEREKKDIQDIQYGLKELMQLKPVSYYWKNTAAGKQQMLGLLAQEVQKIIPELVVEGDGKLGMRSVEMLPVIIKGMQEQQQQINELKKQNEEMKAELKAIKELSRSKTEK
jgi:hypothetical protein